jgi:nicotinamidase-related amidase
MKQSASHRKRVALLLVDVINRFDFPHPERMVRAANRAAPRIQALATRARGAGAPVIYVNDHFGHWLSDFAATVRAARRTDSLGRSVASLLAPERKDYFVLKPEHSAFYSTALAPLLEHLRVGHLVIAGFATNYCVEFTANDAYMRGFAVHVPRDCTASASPALTRASLSHIAKTLKGDIRPSTSVRFPRGRRHALVGA